MTDSNDTMPPMEEVIPGVFLITDKQTAWSVLTEAGLAGPLKARVKEHLSQGNTHPVVMTCETDTNHIQAVRLCGPDEGSNGLVVATLNKDMYSAESVGEVLKPLLVFLGITDDSDVVDYDPSNGMN